MAEIAIGTAGWSYRDWEGIVYPRSERDKLRFLARYVDRIEIDTTFYRIPAPATAQSWHARTADFPGFRFTAKLHQMFTHGPGFGPADSRAFRAARERWSSTEPEPSPRPVSGWTLPTSRGPAALAQLKQAFGDLAGHLELRHIIAAGGVDYLRTLASRSQTRYRGWNSFSCGHRDRRARLPPGSTDARAAWFDSKAGRDQAYNYCYGGSELDGILQRAAEIAKRAKSVTIIANNHYQGKAVVNALEIKGAITGRKGDAPADLVRAYPRLAAIAREADDGAPQQGELDL